MHGKYFKKSCARFSSSVLSLTLIFQLAIGVALPQNANAQFPPEVTADDGGSNGQELIKKGDLQESPEMAATLEEFENVDLSKHPQGTPDVYFLVYQTLVLNGKRYNLSDPNTVVDSISPDFDKVEVRPALDGDGIDFIYVKNGKEKARHEIRSPLGKLKVVNLVRDKVLIQMITADHQMYAIHIPKVRNLIFNAPIPVYHLSPILPGKDLSKMKMEFVTRGVRPPDQIAPNAVVPTGPDTEELYTAGDLMIYSDEPNKNVRTLEGYFSRKVTLYQCFQHYQVMTMLTAIVSPAPKTRDIFLQNSKNPGAVTDHQVNILNSAGQILNTPEGSQALSAMDPLSRNAILSMLVTNPNQAILFQNGAAAAAQEAEVLRDVFQKEEWKGFYENALQAANIDPTQSIRQNNLPLQQRWQEAAKEMSNLSPPVKSLISQTIDRYAIKVVAGILAASAGIIGFTTLGLDGHFGEWGVHFVNRMMDANILPPILKVVSQRVPIWVSKTTLALFVPLVLIIGGLYGKSKKMDPLKGFVTLGIRMASVTQFPLIEKMVNGLKITKNFVAKNVINSITAIASGQRPRDPLTLRQARLNKLKIKSYSWLLSHIAVAEKYGIDISTLLLAENRSPEAIYKAIFESQLKENSTFMREWDLTSRELLFSLSDTYSKIEMEDLAKISTAELERDLNKAKVTAEKLINVRDQKMKLGLKKLKLRFREGSVNLFNYMATFGSGEYKFFREVIPNDFVVTNVGRQFFIDFIMAADLQALWGERAAPDKPQYWSAMRGHFGDLNPKHLSDMGEQVLIYWIRASSNTAQVYQKNPALHESNYDPIENTTMVGKVTTQGFMEGTKMLAKSLFDLRSANYGGMALKTFWTRLNAIQSSISLSLLTRTLLGRETLARAAIGYSYTFIWGFWAFAWPWLLINHGLGALDDAASSNKSRLTNAKAKLSQGLRTNDPILANEGMTELANLYSESNASGSNTDFTDLVKATEKLLNVPAEDRIRFESGISQYVEILIDLQTAMELGDQEAVEKIYENIRALYKGMPEEQEIKNFDGQKLLDYSQKHPPFFTKSNSLLQEVFTLMVGAIPTTIMASKLFAESYDVTKMTWETFRNTGLTAAGLYFTLYQAQKIVNKHGTKIKTRINYWASKINRGQAPAVASGLVMPANPTQGVEDRSPTSELEELRTILNHFRALKSIDDKEAYFNKTKDRIIELQRILVKNRNTRAETIKLLGQASVIGKSVQQAKHGAVQGFPKFFFASILSNLAVAMVDGEMPEQDFLKLLIHNASFSVGAAVGTGVFDGSVMLLSQKLYRNMKDKTLKQMLVKANELNFYDVMKSESNLVNGFLRNQISMLAGTLFNLALYSGKDAKWEDLVAQTVQSQVSFLVAQATVRGLIIRGSLMVGGEKLASAMRVIEVGSKLNWVIGTIVFAFDLFMQDRIDKWKSHVEINTQLQTQIAKGIQAWWRGKSDTDFNYLIQSLQAYWELMVQENVREVTKKYETRQDFLDKNREWIELRNFSKVHPLIIAGLTFQEQKDVKNLWNNYSQEAQISQTNARQITDQHAFKAITDLQNEQESYWNVAKECGESNRIPECGYELVGILEKVGKLEQVILSRGSRILTNPLDAGLGPVSVFALTRLTPQTFNATEWMKLMIGITNEAPPSQSSVAFNVMRQSIQGDVDVRKKDKDYAADEQQVEVLDGFISSKLKPYQDASFIRSGDFDAGYDAAKPKTIVLRAPANQDAKRVTRGVLIEMAYLQKCVDKGIGTLPQKFLAKRNNFIKDPNFISQSTRLEKILDNPVNARFASIRTDENLNQTLQQIKNDPTFLAIIQVVQSVPSSRFGKGYVQYKFSSPVYQSDLAKYQNVMPCK